MKTYKLEVHTGDNFHTVAEKAITVASMTGFKHDVVEFEFNEVKCLVNAKTNPEWLYRDYANSWRMEWKTVGPNCLENYTPEVAAELKRRNAIAEEKAEKQRKESEIKEMAERDLFNNKVKGIELDLSNPEGWKKAREINSDPYGSAVLDYAEGWAKLMQIEIANGKTVAECYDYTQNGLGFMGITGFMFGAAVSTLAQTWKHGEELRKVHNKKYGVSEDRKGTVNPAILTL